MFAVTGVTGNVGGQVARTLLAAGKPVRAVLRDAGKGDTWSALGCEVAIAEIDDKGALAAAFTGAEVVFVLVPPNFDPAPGFPEAQAIAATLFSVLEKARPARVVYLSTIGAHARQSNLLSQHTIIEQALREISSPITFLRPAWFIENCIWDVAPARERGVISSFLQPLDRRIPMVSTDDVGRIAAEALQGTWIGRRIVELEGPQRVSPNDIAAAFSELLGRPVTAEAVPRDTWESLFRSQGMKNPMPRIRMLEGLNEGWIDFRGGIDGSVKGVVPFKAALAKLIKRADARRA